jgi:DNA polymerase III subunit epsilon
MNLHLKSPLAFFDLETTGINISHDRIVELFVLKVMPSGQETVFAQLLNPGMPIPPESSLFHGITDEKVKDAPSFKEIAKNLARFLEGCDLAGFNIVKFDVPLLVEEFLRAGVEFDVSKRKLIDAQKIFHMMEKRTLSAAYRFYCQRNLDNAHSAEADARATFEILQKQVELYAGQPVEDNKGDVVGMIENDMDVLHRLTLTNMVDLAGRIVLNDDGIEIFNFGKHKDKPVHEVLRREPSYYDWMINGDFPLDTKRRLTEIRLRELTNR